MLPKITEVAKLWADPEIRWTSTGKAVATIPLVFSKRTKTENGGWKDAGSLFVRGTLWDDYAQNAVDTLSKGDSVLVTGELMQREYEKDGQKRQSLELRIYDIGPALKWGPAKISRAERSSKTGGMPADDPWASDSSDGDGRSSSRSDWSESVNSSDEAPF